VLGIEVLPETWDAFGDLGLLFAIAALLVRRPTTTRGEVTPAFTRGLLLGLLVAGFVGAANVLHGEVVDGHVHLGSIRIPGAAHLHEGAPAAAFVRPHDVVVTGGDEGVHAVIERVSSLGWLSRVSLRLAGGETLVAHVPNDDLHGAAEGDRVRVDLRNPKAFFVPERDGDGAPVSV
jgi:hypothetical protein